MPAEGDAKKPRPQKAHTRVCTDVCCGLIFFAWLGGMGAIQNYAITNGNLDKLTHGFNWQNEICGVTERVRDRPNLFWCPPVDGSGVGWDLADGICVSDCPTGESMFCPGPASQFHLNVSLGNGAYMVTTGVNRTLTARATYASKQMVFYCVPDSSVESGQALAASFQAEMGNTSSVTAVVEGIRDRGAFFGGVTVFAILLGYGFMFFLNKFVGILIQIMVVIVGLGLFVLGGGFLNVGYCSENSASFCDDRVTDSMDAYVSRENLPTVGYVVGGTLSVLFLVYFCLVCCCMRKTLGVIISSLEDASQLIHKMPTLVLLPVIQALLKIAVLCGLVMGMCWVISLGEPSPVVISEAGASVHGVGRHFAYTDNQFYALLFFGFGCLWLIETITALGQFVISHVVVSEVENETHFSLPLFHGYKNCLKYHIGTIAFGGFVLGALRFVAAIMSMIMKVTSDKEGKQSTLVKCICCCCMCCLQCLTDATELLNELVYTDVAITGDSYMTAAKNVVSTALTNPATYGGVKFATEILGFLGVAGLTFIGTYFPYLILFNPGLFGGYDQMAQTLAQPAQIACTVVSFLISFFISMAFMTSFNQCALALMYIKLFDDAAKKDEAGDYQKLPEGGAVK